MTDDDAPPPKPVILVVDDEALIRILASDMFNEAGYEVIETGTGAEALAVIEARPDVGALFTDVQMPGSPDGLMLAQHMRNVSLDCAIMIASGRVEPHPSELAQRALFVRKPYSVEAVVATFDGLLAGDRRPRAASDGASGRKDKETSASRSDDVDADS